MSCDNDYDDCCLEIVGILINPRPGLDHCVSVESSLLLNGDDEVFQK